MRIKATKGQPGIATEGKDATYVEAAGWGKYRGWRYVLGLVIILRYAGKKLALSRPVIFQYPG